MAPRARARPRPRLAAIRPPALLLADLVVLLATLVAALEFGDPDGRAADQLPWGLLAVPGILVLFKLYGLYDRDAKRMSHSTLDDVPGVFHALVLGTLGLWLVVKLATPDQRLVLEQGSLFLAIGFVGVLVARGAARRIVRRIAAPEQVLLVGTGDDAALLVRKMRDHPAYALAPVGWVGGHDEGDATIGLPRLGDPADLAELCRAHAIERVVIASPVFGDDALADLVRRAGEAELKVSILPTVVDVLGPTTEVDDLAGVTVLGVNPSRISGSSWFLKRALDVAVSAAAMAVLLPLLPFVALAIRLDSSGPVFFRHERLGRGGRRFRVLKLRTMAQDAEERTEELRAQSAHHAWLLLDEDPRVTRVGRLLRQTSLDELPQLWNVLRGEMSLVGPRPMPPDIDRHIGGWGRRRLDLTPGMTGLWQVLGRTSIPFEEMIKLDYLYVSSWTLWGDVRLLLRTVFVVLSRRGVN